MATPVSRCTHAECDQCGWLGPIKDLVTESSSKSLSEYCPECNSDDTWWLTGEEYQERLKSYE